MSVPQIDAQRTHTPTQPPPASTPRPKRQKGRPNREAREQTLRGRLQASRNEVDRLLRQNIELAREVERLGAYVVSTSDAIDALRDLGEDLQVVEMALLSPHTRECHDTNFVSNNVMRLGRRLTAIAEGLLDAPTTKGD